MLTLVPPLSRSQRLSEWKVHCGVLLGSAITAAVPMIHRTYGWAGSWCWIDPDARFGKVYQFASFFAPLWFIIICVCVMYGRCVPFHIRSGASVRQRFLSARCDVHDDGVVCFHGCVCCL